MKIEFTQFPFPAGQKRPAMLKQADLPCFLYTEEHPESSDLNWMVASTEHMTVGEYQLAPGTFFDPADVHAGDEIYYVQRGEVTMFQPESGQIIVLKEGEGILMPKGCPHVGYNFGESEARMLYVVAPLIWDEQGPPLEYTGAYRIYKYKEREE